MIEYSTSYKKYYIAFSLVLADDLLILIGRRDLLNVSAFQKTVFPRRRHDGERGRDLT